MKPKQRVSPKVIKDKPVEKQKIDSKDIAANKKISNVVEKANNKKSVLENIRSTAASAIRPAMSKSKEEDTASRIAAPSRADYYTK